MSQPHPPPQHPSPYPQQSWSDPGAAVPEQAHPGSWAPQPGPSQPGSPQPAVSPYAGSPYGAQPYRGHPRPPHGPSGPAPDNSMGVTALVLAIVGLLLSWIPFVGLVSVVLGGLAVVFGLVGWNRARQGRAGLALPVAGAAIGIVTVVVAVLSTVLVTRLFVPADDTPGARPAVSDGGAPPAVDLPVGGPAAGQPPADTGTVPAPGTFTWDDGLSVQVSAPRSVEFSETACCPEGARPGVAFDVTVVNGTSEVIEAYALIPTLTVDGRPVEQVFDVEEDFDGVTVSVPPGRELVVTVAFDAPGGDLLLEFTSFDRDPAFFTATL